MIATEQFETVDEAIAYFWHYHEGFSAALSCTDNPDCPRHGQNTAADRESIAALRDRFSADMCLVIVELYYQQGQQS